MTTDREGTTVSSRTPCVSLMSSGILSSSCSRATAGSDSAGSISCWTSVSARIGTSSPSISTGTGSSSGASVSTVSTTKATSSWATGTDSSGKGTSSFCKLGISTIKAPSSSSSETISESTITAISSSVLGGRVSSWSKSTISISWR